MTSRLCSEASLQSACSSELLRSERSDPTRCCTTTKRQMLEREDRIIEFADLVEFIDVPVKQYSSGMYMRLAFAVATEVDPDILLLDEVLSVGDISFQQKCINRIRSFHDSHKTILFVTHSVQYATSFCDRAILMEKGRVEADGNLSDHPKPANSYHLKTGQRE
jgi:ABC-type polysaccharide/polyol phosphate transport system ATPase subunit